MASLHFTPSEYESGRITASSGSIVVGALFPALNQPGAKWRWRLWVTGSFSAQSGEAKSELSARNALLSAWEEFLRAANLRAAS